MKIKDIVGRILIQFWDLMFLLDNTDFQFRKKYNYTTIHTIQPMKIDCILSSILTK